MPTGMPTDADLALIEELARHEIEVTVRQLQDWRRKAIVSGPEVVRHGRRGTESTRYPDTAPMEVARVYYLLQEGSTMAEVVVSLFGVGVTPTEKALRSAYNTILNQWEAKGRIGLILSEEPGTRYARRVRRFAESIGQGSPKAKERWDERARATALEESQKFDLATGKRLRYTVKDIRESDTAGFLESFIEGGGDPLPILESIGMPAEVSDLVEESGGWPTFFEMRSALSATLYEDLIKCRDEIREFMKTQNEPLFPEEFSQALRDDMDDASKVGLYVGLGLLYPLAVSLRDVDETAVEEAK